ncbi:transglycosylase [Synechococcus sp. ATX 2A4]|uniref:type IV pilus biogenesis protein EbsA n=1 Tax=Synechococcus sp. ATX 2A4 TaxID=2823727 RepID=UPI0037D993FE|nr:transglycosylase [Synechococcus sp. ATX 2A4]
MFSEGTAQGSSTLPQEAAQVALFAPYCGGLSREGWLQRGLDQLALNRVNGLRPLHPNGAHRFELSWTSGAAPQQPSQCELAFPDHPEIHYSFTVPTYHLVGWLMDLLEDRAVSGGGDLPETFWRWLILGEVPPPVSS